MSRARKLTLAAFGLALLLSSLVIGAIVYREPLLCVRSPLQPADALVVLGGEPITRSSHAAMLISNGFAPRVFVTGFGDCEKNRQLLQGFGVQTNLVPIQVECASLSTQQNAEFTIPLLREQKCRRVILVTSWYHSRRALGTFRKYAPDMEFISAPAPQRRSARHDRRYAAAEYFKTAWYAVRFGVWPTFERSVKP
jgi:uncharacterized SAM-binding protein YcdF (DUF218 family)